MLDLRLYLPYAGEELALVIESRNDDIASLATRGVKAKVIHDKARDRVVARVNLGH